jgi:toxin ParE1/3/4
MARILWSTEARRDIRAIAEYFENESPAYAISLVRTLYGAVRRLERFPQSGRKVPEIGNSLFLEVIVAGYRIVYLTSEDCVERVTIAHGRQDLEKKFRDQ